MIYIRQSFTYLLRGKPITAYISKPFTGDHSPDVIFSGLDEKHPHGWYTSYVTEVEKNV